MLAQASLFASLDPAPPESSALGRRLDLGSGAWVDHVPFWLPGADRRFDVLASTLSWAAHERPMYDRMVDVPRLVTRLERGAEQCPTFVEETAAALDDRYDVRFESIGANWYRSGRDSVAWHADRVRRPGDSITAIVSLGEPRTFLLRPAGGGRSRSWELGHGDLLVLGGTIQSGWHHAVPKRRTAGQRICLMFRWSAA